MNIRKAPSQGTQPSASAIATSTLWNTRPFDSDIYVSPATRERLMKD